ncbi:hypothetical protein Dda_1607 [Drechslerella dactyloides]|uniref:Xylanolytic transcriptional activator regulatory domain-containing protein n=1 Tax=Drechslerella dactyloides TaxID=74499 RepID=A0AAD6NN85_DREDA|nr:hypothetical protein Dda_1607 [Drechslerella dactyloides]
MAGAKNKLPRRSLSTSSSSTAASTRVPQRPPIDDNDIKRFRVIVERSSTNRGLTQGASGWDEAYDIEYANPVIDPRRSVFKYWLHKTFVEPGIKPRPVALFNFYTRDLVMFEEMDRIPTMELGSRKIPITAGYLSLLHPLKGHRADAKPHPVFGYNFPWNHFSRSQWIAVYSKTSTYIQTYNFESDRYTTVLDRWVSKDYYLNQILLEDLQEGRLYLTPWDAVSVIGREIFIENLNKIVIKPSKWLYIHILLPLTVILYLFSLIFRGGSRTGAPGPAYNETLLKDTIEKLAGQAVASNLNGNPECDGQTPCRNCIKAGVLCMTITQAQLSGTIGDVRTSTEPPVKRHRTLSLDRDPFVGLLREDGSYTRYEAATDATLSPGLPSPISPLSEGRSVYGSPQCSSVRTVVKKPQKTCPHARTTTEQMANCLREILLEREGSLSTGVRACCKKAGSSSHADRPEVRMPTYDEVTTLLSVFRTHVSSIIDPALDSHFVSLVKTPSFMNHPINRHYLSEVILAISYQCVASATAAIKRKFSSITADAAQARASAHFKSAQAGFDMAGAIENPDVSAVEVLLLMSVYKFLEGAAAAASSLAGLAISMAQTLGLHELNHASAVERSTAEIHTGIWNSLYNLDRVLSITTSRAYILPHDSNPLSPTSPVSDICSIVGKIMRATTTPSSTPEQLQPLSHDLKTFNSSLPTAYKWSTILSTTLPPQELMKSLHVNALYFCAIFRLTKPSLLSTLLRVTAANLTPRRIPSPLPASNNMIFPLAFATESTSSSAAFAADITATHESRWSEAGIYSAQTSLRIFERARHSGIAMHGTPLFETWLTLSFLICIAGLFAFPASTRDLLLHHGANSDGDTAAAANCRPRRTPHDVEGRVAQVAHLYQGLIATARMSPRLCALATFINDLRGWMGRRAEESSSGKDSFEALFGDGGAVDADMVVEAAVGNIAATPASAVEGLRAGISGEKEDVSLAGLLPETPASMAASSSSARGDEEGARDGAVAEVVGGGSGDRRAVGDVDDLWQKIFEDLEPADLEPEEALQRLGYCLDGGSEMTALDRLIRKSDVFA